MEEQLKIIFYWPETLATPVDKSSKTFCPILDKDISFGNGKTFCIYHTDAQKFNCVKGRFFPRKCKVPCLGLIKKIQ